MVAPAAAPKPATAVPAHEVAAHATSPAPAIDAVRWVEPDGGPDIMSPRRASGPSLVPVLPVSSERPPVWSVLGDSNDANEVKGEPMSSFFAMGPPIQSQSTS